MRLKSLAIAALALALPTLALADPTGTFDVRGINPDDGGQYTGRVDITRTGETYKVVWNIAGDQLTGTGVGIRLVDGRIVTGPASKDDTGISIAYGSGDSYGTVVYFEQPDGSWQGTWAYSQWDHVSTEQWIPKDVKVISKVVSEVEKIEKVDETVRTLPAVRKVSAPAPTLAGPKQ